MHYGEGLQDILNFSERLSWKAKTRNNMKWFKNKALNIDRFYPDIIDSNKLATYLENYALLNGDGDSLMRSFGADMPSSLQSEGIEPAYTKMQHYDIISPLVFGLLGEQHQRPFQYRVVDSSEYTQNLLKFKRVQFFQNYLREKYIAPIQQQAAQRWMMDNGIQDLMMLTPEQQQQAQSEIQKRAEEQTPNEFERFLRKGFKSPREAQAVKLLGYLEKELDLKYLTDEGFKHALVTGEEVYFVGIRNGKPIVEWVNPLNFLTRGKPKNSFVEDNEFAKHWEWIRPTDVWDRYASQITKRSDLKKLDAIIQRARGDSGHQEPLENKMRHIIAKASLDLKLTLPNIDLRTKEGQRKYYEQLHREAGENDYITEDLVRDVHFVWKSLREVKEIHRVNPEGGFDRFYVDESYEFNPAKGDIEEVTMWVPQVYQARMIDNGGGLSDDPLFVDLGPLPYQNTSFKEPNGAKLPYVGAEYNKHSGNADNVAPMERPKKWQHAYNVQSARIKEMEATDIGKVMLMTLAAKPEGWDWGKFLEVVRYAKIAPIDLSKAGLNPAEANVFKSIDMSNMADIIPRLNYLNYLRDMAALSISFNSSRLGEASPYSTVANNQQNLMQAINQSKHVSKIHDKIVERMLNRLYGVSRVAYKDNPFYARYILDDLSMAELELDTEMLKSSEIGVFVVTSGEEFANVQLAKELLLPLIQNGQLSAPDAVKLMWSKSKGEILNFAEEIELKQQIQASQAMQANAANEQQIHELKKELIVLQENMKTMRQREMDITKLKMSALSSTFMKQAQDVNENKEADSIERDRENREFEREELKEKMRIELEKNKVDAREAAVKESLAELEWAKFRRGDDKPQNNKS